MGTIFLVGEAEVGEELEEGEVEGSGPLRLLAGVSEKSSLPSGPLSKRPRGTGRAGQRRETTVGKKLSRVRWVTPRNNMELG